MAKIDGVLTGADNEPIMIVYFARISMSSTRATQGSWLVAFSQFFATLTKRRLKRGVFRSIFDLHVSINRFLKEHNTQPKPFVWTADPEKIIAAVRRGHQMLDSIH